MILELLFVVFFILAVFTSGPWAPAPYGNWGWACILFCVGILGWVLFHGARAL